MRKYGEQNKGGEPVLLQNEMVIKRVILQFAIL